jgi:hypothetical protein
MGLEESGGVVDPVPIRSATGGTFAFMTGQCNHSGPTAVEPMGFGQGTDR